jgi:hypothetical protein
VAERILDGREEATDELVTCAFETDEDTELEPDGLLVEDAAPRLACELELGRAPDKLTELEIMEEGSVLADTMAEDVARELGLEAELATCEVEASVDSLVEEKSPVEVVALEDEMLKPELADVKIVPTENERLELGGRDVDTATEELELVNAMEEDIDEDSGNELVETISEELELDEEVYAVREYTAITETPPQSSNGFPTQGTSATYAPDVPVRLA